jgi:hypothetical protein
VEASPGAGLLYSAENFNFFVGKLLEIFVIKTPSLGKNLNPDPNPDPDPDPNS